VTRLTTQLRRLLHNSPRTAIVGIGSEMRGDDGCGLIVAEKLRRAFSRSRKLKIFIGGTAPENFTGAIRTFKPGLIILIDAADFKKKPGAVRLIAPEEAEGTCFCTHQLPLQIMADYLRSSLACRVMIIGIQAKNLDFGSAMTAPVEKACNGLAKTLRALF
jgi:hydrogenase 3 maturation protease